MAAASATSVNRDMETSMERLSTGKRINSAADDAVGLAISTRMDSQVRAMSMQVRNASDGISVIQSAEGAMQETTNILQRMFELSVQASNETFNDSDRTAIQAEVTQLQAEIDRIAKDTQFNGQNILDGNFLAKTLNVGFTDKGSIGVSIGDQSSAALSGAGTKDATAVLLSSSSNIALGADTQTAVASTATAAVIKVDNQTATISQSQFNVGFNATQSLTASTSVTNLAAGTEGFAQVDRLTLSGRFEIGDSVSLSGIATGGAPIAHTVVKADIGTDDAATLTAVRNKLVAAINNSANNATVTAANDGTDAIKLTGKTATPSFSAVVTATNVVVDNTQDITLETTPSAGVLVANVTAQAQKDTFSLATPVDGSTVRVTIGTTNFDHLVTTGQTEDQVSAALVTLINADTALKVTATAGAAGSKELILEADDAGTAFTAKSVVLAVPADGVKTTAAGATEKQKDTFTLATPVDGSTVRVTIGTTNFDHLVTTGQTADQVSAALVTLINADINLAVAATAGAATSGELILEADVDNVPFVAKSVVLLVPADGTKTTANRAAVAQIETATLAGKFEIGDVVSIAGLAANAISHTVVAADIGADNAATLTAVRNKLIDAINDTANNATVGAVSSGTDKITLTADTAGTLFTPVVTATDKPVDNTQAVSRATITNIVDAAAGNGVTTAAAAGARDTQIANVDTVTSATGLDGIVDVRSTQLTGAIKLGDVISFDVDGPTVGNAGTVAAVTHTVTADDLVADATQTKRNAIDSFVNRFNNASTAQRSDAAGGVLTASRSGDDVITFTASIASATNIAQGVTVTNRTNTANINATSGDVTAANGSVGSTATVAIGGDGATLQEGDTLTMAITDDLGADFVYTITRENIGADNAATLENVRASFIAEFNAAPEAGRKNLQSGVISAAASVSDPSAIVFTGAETATGATFAYTFTGANRVEDNTTGFLLAPVAVTTATNEAGTAVGPVEDNNRVATVSTKVVRFDAAEIEVGDTIELDVAGTKVSYTVAEGNDAAAISTALRDLINDLGGQGERIATEGAGIIAATAADGVLTLTSAKTGSGSDFAVTANTVNFSGRAQNTLFDLSSTNVLEEGDKVRITLSTNNFIEAEVTKEMVDSGGASARASIIAALVAKSDDLQGVTLQRVSGQNTQLRIVGEDIGVAFTASMTEVNRSARAQQDVVNVGGEVGKGDVFSLTVADSDGNGGVTVSVTVGDELASIRSNDDRLVAVRDALLNAAKNSTGVMGQLSRIESDGANGIKLTAATAGTGITTTAATTNNTNFAAQKQVDNVTLGGDAEVGDVFAIDLGDGNAVSYTVTAEDAAGATAADRLQAARDGLVAAPSVPIRVRHLSG